MAERARTPATKPDNLGSSPRMPWWEEGTDVGELSSDPLTCCGILTPIHTHKQMSFLLTKKYSSSGNMHIGSIAHSLETYLHEAFMVLNKLWSPGVVAPNIHTA